MPFVASWASKIQRSLQLLRPGSVSELIGLNVQEAHRKNSAQKIQLGPGRATNHSDWITGTDSDLGQSEKCSYSIEMVRGLERQLSVAVIHRSADNIEPAAAIEPATPDG